jgi:hypothetical protein
MLKRSLIIFYIALVVVEIQGCFVPRDVTTDSMLELSLVNYHRYHSRAYDTDISAKNPLSLSAKTFFMGTKDNYAANAGMLFTAYINATPAIWLGINSAAMASKIAGEHTGGLDDIQFKVAYDILSIEDCHATGYLVATAPTGKRYSGCPSLQPRVGSRNGSLGFGINIDTVVGDIGDYNFSWLCDLKYRHTFNPDCYYAPRNTLDLWTALHFPIYQAQLEIGYDFWWQQPVSRQVSVSQKLYADGGYTYAYNNCSILFALGAAYEFATKRAFERWNVWLTIGIAF